MPLIIPNGWCWFCIALMVVIITSMIMKNLSRWFVTKDPNVKSFSIFDLELAGTESEMDNTLKGITRLESADAALVFRQLKNHFYIDFLFMVGAYGALFIGCMEIASRMPMAGIIYFSVLAWLQLLVLACDIYENCYILRKIKLIMKAPEDMPKPDPKIKTKGFAIYHVAEVLKWTIAMLALVCFISSSLYYWIANGYSIASLHYLLLITGEVIFYLLISKTAFKKGSPEIIAFK